MFTQRDASQDKPGSDELYTIGTRGAIKRVNRSESGIELVVQGLERVAMVHMEQTEPYLKAKVRDLNVTGIDGSIKGDMNLWRAWIARA